jgi:hypothetical protein
MVKHRYYDIRDHLESRHQMLCNAARASGDETCPQTGKPLIDPLQEGFTVLAALSRQKLLVRHCTSQDDEDYIITFADDTFGASRRSVTMKTL